MAWALNSIDDRQSYPAPAGTNLYLVESDSGLIATDATPDAALILGTLAIQPNGAKLEAGIQDLRILPGNPSNSHPNNGGNDNSPVEGFTLQAKTENRVESIILRHLDRISSINGASALTFQWVSPQVQVRSSEKNSESPAVNVDGEIVNAEEETEDDDEDLDNTVVPGVSKSQTLRSTPHLSVSHSVIIQETPTIDRMDKRVDLPSRTGLPELSKETSTATAIVYSTAPQEQHDLAKPEGPADIVMDDSVDKLADVKEAPQKPTMRHPKIKIPKSAKRQSPVVEDEDVSSPTTRVTKRRKVDDDITDSEATPVQTARKTAVNRRGQGLATQTESPPPRSQRTQRSTQNSTTSSAPVVEGNYDGPKPRVAFSSSSIQPNTPLAKFLKKNGGTIVDAVDADCNLVCIKDAPVPKTAKVLQAIALGIPVVTDKWLIDSAKASRLLPLELYIPPSLTAVWKIPQDQLFKGYTIFFTPALKAHYKAAFADMEKLCRAVGARRVVSKKPGGKDVPDAESSIFLAVEEGDKDVLALEKEGHTCFTKDFLTSSILAGEVDLQSKQFVVRKEMKVGKKLRRRGT